MTLLRCPSLRLILGSLVASTGLAFSTVDGASSYPSNNSLGDKTSTMAGGADSNPIGNLAVTLRQTSPSPPTVRVSVANNNDHDVTILSYQSPLDGLALPLGLLSIMPAGSSEPLELLTIKAGRMWPPPDDCLIVVAPGAAATNDLVLKAPTVPMDKLAGKATVALKGRWMAVWDRPRDKLSDREIENSSGSAFAGDFATEDLEITIG